MCRIYMLDVSYVMYVSYMHIRCVIRRVVYVYIGCVIYDVCVVYVYLKCHNNVSVVYVYWMCRTLCRIYILDAS